MKTISLLTPEQKQKAIDDIIAYFLDEKGEEIGIIAAENILDALLDSIGKPIYNKAVKDIKKLVSDQLTNLQIDIEALSEFEE